MDIISKLAVKPLLIGSAIVVALLLLALGVQTLRLSAAENAKVTAEANLTVANTNLGTAKSNVEAWQRGADSWKAAFYKLKGIRDRERADRDRIDSENDQAIARSAQREKLLRTELDTLKRKRQDARKDPDCLKFLEMPLCPALQSPSR